MPSYWEQYKKKKTDYQKQAAKYTKPTAADIWRAKQIKEAPRRQATARAPKTPKIVSQPPTPEIRAEEEAYARGMQQMLARQEAEADQRALYWQEAFPSTLFTPEMYQGATGLYSPATRRGVGQIPTGLQQAGYAPGAYVSQARSTLPATMISQGLGAISRFFGGQTPYVFDDPGGPGPAPRRYYGGGGQAAMRGTQQGYSTGLVNWRIGL